MTMKYVVTGRVHPERSDIFFSRIEMRTEEGGVQIASCDASQFTVFLDDPSIDGWITAAVHGGEAATMVITALGFALGTGYSVEVVQVTEEDGTPHVFGVRPQGSTPQETLSIEPTQITFNRALSLSARDVFFRLALRDYIRAINDVRDCATYCYRAIEGIKSSYVFKTGIDRWDDMHSSLGTTRDDIAETVKSYADAVRHGNWVSARPTNGLERWKMLSLTRDILMKYLDHAAPVAPSQLPPA